MSKKKRSKVHTSTKAEKAANAAIAAQWGAMTRSMQPHVISPEAAAIAAQYGAMTLGMYAEKKKPRRKLTDAEKSARGRVLAAHAAVARAARLPGGKRHAAKKKATKRSKVAATVTRSRTASRPAKKAASRVGKKKTRTVTAKQAVAEASRKALQRWLCQGPRRSGCGSGGTRVVSGSGSFVRIRPSPLMSAAGR